MTTADPSSAFALLNKALTLLSSTRAELDSALRRVGKLPTAEEDKATITAMKERADEIESAIRLERTHLRARALEAAQNGVGNITEQMAGLKMESNAKKQTTQLPPLIDRMDDTSAAPDLRNLVDFPPHFVPVPCKPLFFDLASGHIEYPMEALAARGRRQAEDGKAAAGISGWLGGWFGGKKK
jgi:signal recognition particle subunit SRP68